MLHNVYLQISAAMLHRVKAQQCAASWQARLLSLIDAEELCRYHFVLVLLCKANKKTKVTLVPNAKYLQDMANLPPPVKRKNKVRFLLLYVTYDMPFICAAPCRL